jgi:lambda repressor-like predicted transcriptional regulator
MQSYVYGSQATDLIAAALNRTGMAVGVMATATGIPDEYAVLVYRGHTDTPGPELERLVASAVGCKPGEVVCWHTGQSHMISVFAGFPVSAQRFREEH